MWISFFLGENDYGLGGDGDCRIKVSTFVIVIVQTDVGH